MVATHIFPRKRIVTPCEGQKRISCHASRTSEKQISPKARCSAALRADSGHPVCLGDEISDLNAPASSLYLSLLTVAPLFVKRNADASASITATTMKTTPASAPGPAPRSGERAYGLLLALAFFLAPALHAGVIVSNTGNTSTGFMKSSDAQQGWMAQAFDTGT